VTPDSGDFVETVYRGQIRRFARVVGVGSCGWRLGGGHAGDQCFDAPIEVFDLCAEAVDLIQQQGRELTVVLVEASGQCLDQGRAFDAQSSFGQLGEHARVTLTGDQCLDHRPAGDPHHVGGHRGQFD